jgi:hypothetical protein
VGVNVTDEVSDVVTDVSDAVSDTRPEITNGNNVVSDVTDVTDLAGGRACAQCNAADDGTMRKHKGVWLHPECVRFWKPEDLGIPDFLDRTVPRP